MTEEPDFVRANRKITDATEWRGDVTISLGDESYTFAHRLLNENEYLDVKRKMDVGEMTDGDGAQGNVGQTEEQQRLLELQQKGDDLTDEEERELEKLNRKVAQQTDSIEDSLGDEGYELFTELGRKAIEPTDEDIDYVYNASPGEMVDMLGLEELPTHYDKEFVRERLSDQLSEMVTEQPFPIKLNVGMQAFSETLTVLGNGLQE